MKDSIMRLFIFIPSIFVCISFLESQGFGNKYENSFDILLGYLNENNITYFEDTFKTKVEINSKDTFQYLGAIKDTSYIIGTNGNWSPDIFEIDKENKIILDFASGSKNKEIATIFNFFDVIKNTASIIKKKNIIVSDYIIIGINIKTSKPLILLLEGLRNINIKNVIFIKLSIEFLKGKIKEQTKRVVITNLKMEIK